MSDVLTAPAGMCPVAPLREAFECSGKTLSEVAAALGWYSKGYPDGPRVSRSLGLRSGWPDGKGGLKRPDHISAERASRLAEAIGVMPVEIGL